MVMKGFILHPKAPELGLHQMPLSIIYRTSLFESYPSVRWYSQGIQNSRKDDGISDLKYSSFLEIHLFCFLISRYYVSGFLYWPSSIPCHVFKYLFNLTRQALSAEYKLNLHSTPFSSWDHCYFWLCDSFTALIHGTHLSLHTFPYLPFSLGLFQISWVVT